MNQAFDDFVKELCNTNVNLNEAVFFVKSAVFLEQQLEQYLHIERQHQHSLRFLILAAKKLKNQETDKKFWDALLAFNTLIEAAVESKCTRKTTSKWLRFINIIESLQGYAGSQVFTSTNIRQRRKLRMFFAYMLTWEHLRYIAGNDDDYSPSDEILEEFAQLSADDDHIHYHEH